MNSRVVLGIEFSLFALIGLWIAPLLFAETIKLKSGQEIEGNIIDSTYTSVTVNAQSLPLTIFLDDIETIDGKSINALKEGGILVSAYAMMMLSSYEEESRLFITKVSAPAQMYNQRGMRCIMDGDPLEAISQFSKAIKVNPFAANAYRNRGLAYCSEQLKDYDQAITNFNKALEINPAEGDAYFERALAYTAKHDYENAGLDLYKAKIFKLRYYAKLYPEFIKHFSDISGQNVPDPDGVSVDSKTAQEIITECNKAIEADPGDVKYYVDRAKAYLAIRAYDKAIADYSQALKLRPDEGSVYLARGQTYFKLAQLDWAIADYDQAIARDNADAQAYNDRAVAFFFKGEYDKSRQDVKQALALEYHMHPRFLQELQRILGREE